MTAPPILRTAAITDQGARKRQEDAILHEPLAGFFGVFDGLSAYPHGDLNSRLAASSLLRHWSLDGHPRTDGGLLRAWGRACEDLDDLLHGDTTATVGMVLGEGRCMMVAHVGDGGLTCVDARGVHRRTERHGEGAWCKRAMRGGGSGLLRPLPSPAPDLHTVPLIAGDVIILHTDGLDAIMCDAAAVMAACQERDPHTIARRLIEGARARGSEGNASCVVIVVDLDLDAIARRISPEAREAAGKWAGVGVDGGLVI